MTSPHHHAEPLDVFGTVFLEAGASVGSDSDGDLWPTAWADDGHLYTANGDGAGFSDGAFGDIVVSRIEGDPETGLRGERLAAEREVSPVWGDPAQFNCKPTGIVAVDSNGDGRDELYLAVQDLPYGTGPDTFNHVPAASIVRSDDYGRTWHPTEHPMFTDHLFTTIMFLDFGQSNQQASVLGPDCADHVYAYGLDGNWRTSYSQVVDDPSDLYLARVTAPHIQDRERWQFFAGTDSSGAPSWSEDIGARVPVLTDTRRLYQDHPEPGPNGQTVIAQGGVVYNAPLGCYLYSSWTEFTFQFYVAEQPWGPWTLFHQHDFGPFPWVGPEGDRPQHGGYATTIPSKFISADGQDLWLQSNWFWGAGAYTGRSYHFSLRRMQLRPFAHLANSTTPDAESNLADARTGAVVIASNCRTGHPEVLQDGHRHRSEDGWNGQDNMINFWGYTWPYAHRIGSVVYTSGPRDYISGWFDQTPQVEARVQGVWQSVSDVSVTPDYPGDDTATGHRRYVFTFPTIIASGIRISGRPAGMRGYTAIAELEVYAENGTSPPSV